ncbi:MAG: ribosomal large subunit pseudouridine synthase [Bacteriovoracaceae bacterium]|nr:ribosomal large subunit pseudouridine synthase [Bacteriovoracaceae bacterium]
MPKFPTILRETKSWFVIDKPSGLHTVASKKNLEPSVEGWLKENFPEQNILTEAGIVHRLDQVTSGCLLVAKNDESFEHLKKLIHSETGMNKTYLALVKGKCSSGKFDFNFSSRYKGSKKVTVAESGKASEQGQCRWEFLEFKNGFSLLKISLLSPGRRHQIRAGLAHLGFPIRGDVLYGGPGWKNNFGLHAFSLKWDKNEVECSPPKTWEI